jgi:hypothetical protein
MIEFQTIYTVCETDPGTGYIVRIVGSWHDKEKAEEFASRKSYYRLEETEIYKYSE